MTLSVSVSVLPSDMSPKVKGTVLIHGDSDHSGGNQEVAPAISVTTSMYGAAFTQSLLDSSVTITSFPL